MSSSASKQTRPQNLAGKIAIVTGGSRSIGAAIAFELAQRGAKVVITYTQTKSDAQAQGVVDQIKALGNGSSAIAVRADLREPSSAKTIVDNTVSQFGPHIDVLVNNAGIEVVKSIRDIGVDDFGLVYDLNVRAPMLLMKEVLPYLRSPGRIVNMGSVGGRLGLKNLSVYCSSKAAVEGLTRCWAAELGVAKHTVNTVNPGPVPSEMLDKIPKEIVEMQRQSTPIENRLGTLDDIAQIVT